jgi:hypothetical protein
MGLFFRMCAGIRLLNYFQKNMKNKILYLIGSVLGIVPIYPIFWWIKTCLAFPDSTHSEWVSIYNETILFGLNSGVPSHLITIFCGILSILCFSLLLHWRNKAGDKGIDKLNLLLLIVVSIFTFLNIFSIL